MKKYILFVLAFFGMMLLPQKIFAQQMISSVTHFYYYLPVKIYNIDSHGNRMDRGVAQLQDDMNNQATFVQIEVQNDTVYTGMFHVNLNPQDCTFNKYRFYAGLGFALKTSNLKFGYDPNGKINSLALEDATTRLTLDKTARTITFTYLDYDRESTVQAQPEYYYSQGVENVEKLEREDCCRRALGPDDFDQQFEFLVALLHHNW